MRFGKLIIYFTLLFFTATTIAANATIDSLRKVLKTDLSDSIKFNVLSDIAYEYFDKLEYDSAIFFNKQVVELSSGKKNTKALTSAYYYLGNIYYRQGKYELALSYYQNAIDNALQMDDKKNIPIFNNAIGAIYRSQGNYIKAIEYYQKNLKLAEEINDSMMIGHSYNNIANVYSSFGIYKKAIESYEKAIPIYKNLDQMDYLAITHMNMGIAYRKLKEYQQALDNYFICQNIVNKTKRIRSLAQVKSELGSLYAEMGDLKLAIKNLTEAHSVYQSLGEDASSATILQDIGLCHKRLGNYELALSYLKRSLDVEQKMNMTKEMMDAYKNIAEVYYLQGNYRNAYENFKTYSTLKDTLLSNEFLKQIQELEVKYETDKKEKEIKLKNADLEKKESDAKRKNILLYAVTLIALMILGFSFVLYRQFSEKKKANILLAAQNDEIKKQRDQIFQQKKEITDSIHYASRIQRAVLPSTKVLEDNGLQYFILYKPRDIVSGDFYWINQKDNKIIIAAADCTGHGVPGAFMSMLGMTLLNEIVSKGEIHTAAEILDLLRLLVVRSLHQSGKQEETKDGMDMALCVIDPEANICQFAGAFNPLYLIRGEELIEGVADRMPVGFHDRLCIPFTNTEIPIQKGDRIYIFSDGYVDQFGGENGKKFMAKKFKQLLISLQNEPMESQRDILDKTITDWRGELDQVDDILVIGLKI